MNPKQLLLRHSGRYPSLFLVFCLISLFSLKNHLMPIILNPEFLALRRISLFPSPKKIAPAGRKKPHVLKNLLGLRDLLPAKRELWKSVTPIQKTNSSNEKSLDDALWLINKPITYSSYCKKWLVPYLQMEKDFRLLPTHRGKSVCAIAGRSCHVLAIWN